MCCDVQSWKDSSSALIVLFSFNIDSEEGVFYVISYLEHKLSLENLRHFTINSNRTIIYVTPIVLVTNNTADVGALATFVNACTAEGLESRQFGQTIVAKIR